MIIAVDVNGLIYKANATYTPEDYFGASGVYEITTTFSGRELVGRPLTEFAVDETLLVQPGNVDLLPDIRRKQISIANARCRLEIELGFPSSALGTAHQYPCKEEDQTNLMATFVLAKELNVSKPFKCRDSSGVADYRMHTVAELHQVGQDAELHKMTALVKANTLKAQIEVATTKTDVEAIVW